MLVADQPDGDRGVQDLFGRLLRGVLGRSAALPKGGGASPSGMLSP